MYTREPSNNKPDFTGQLRGYYLEKARERKVALLVEQIQKLDARFAELLSAGQSAREDLADLENQLQETIHEINELALPRDQFEDYLGRIKNCREAIQRAHEQKRINDFMLQLLHSHHALDQQLSKENYFNHYQSPDYMNHGMEALAADLQHLLQLAEPFERINTDLLKECIATIHGFSCQPFLGATQFYDSAIINVLKFFHLFLAEVKKHVVDYDERYEHYLLGTGKNIQESIRKLKNNFLKDSFCCDNNSNTKSPASISSRSDVHNYDVGNLPSDIWDQIFNSLSSTKDKESRTNFGLTCSLFQSISQSHQKNLISNMQRNYTEKPTVALLCSLYNSVTHMAVLPNGNIAVLTYGLRGLGDLLFPVRSPNFILDGRTGKRIRGFGDVGQYFDHLVALPNSDLVTLRKMESTDYCLCVWDSESGKCKKRFKISHGSFKEIIDFRVMDDKTIFLSVSTQGNSCCYAIINIDQGQLLDKTVVNQPYDEYRAARLLRTAKLSDELACVLDYGAISFYHGNRCIKAFDRDEHILVGNIGNILHSNIQLRSDGNMIISFTESKWNRLGNYSPETRIYVFTFPLRHENELSQTVSCTRNNKQ